MVEYKSIGDSLTDEEFYVFVSLLRANNTINRAFNIEEETITEDHFRLEFDFTGTSILSNGILITDKTKENPPTVELQDATLPHSTYYLNLHVLDIEDYELEAENPNPTTELLTIELIEDEPVTFPITNMDNGLIILFDDAEVLIKHNKPTIIPITEE